MTKTEVHDCSTLRLQREATYLTDELSEACVCGDDRAHVEHDLCLVLDELRTRGC